MVLKNWTVNLNIIDKIEIISEKSLMYYNLYF